VTAGSLRLVKKKPPTTKTTTSATTTVTTSPTCAAFDLGGGEKLDGEPT